MDEEITLKDKVAALSEYLQSVLAKMEKDFPRSAVVDMPEFNQGFLEGQKQMLYCTISFVERNFKE